MRALVVGASGLVGSRLLEALHAAGVEATGTYHWRVLDGGLQCDIRERASVQRCASAARPDVVFLAVNTPGGVDFCESHSEEAYELNVEGTRNIADAFSGMATLLVYYSTDYIFDGTAGPYSEDGEPCPRNVYGMTKRDAEGVVREWAGEHLIIRTTAVFGWDVHSRNFAMSVWERLRAGERMLVPDDQWCHPTLADDLATLSVQAVREACRGTLNVVGRDYMCRSELGRALAQTMALDSDLIIPVPTVQTPQLAHRPLRGGLRTERLQELLGFDPPDLGSALARFRSRWRREIDDAMGFRPAK